MEIPTLPTDSTYKFAAVLGSVVATVAMWFYMSSTNQFMLDSQTLMVKHEIIRSKIKDLKESVAEEAKKKVSSHEDIVRLRTAVEKNEEEMNKLDIDRKIIDTRYNNDKLLFRLSILLGLSGAVFAGWGFHQWHYKIQVPQDQLIVEQLVALRLARQEAMTRAEIKRQEQRQEP